VGKESLW